MQESKGKWKRTRTISSDDPNAQEKLEKKLITLEERQECMKRANAYFKKQQTMRGYAGLSDEMAARMDRDIQRRAGERKPFPTHQMRNNGANIRRVKERIAALKKRDALSADEGWDFPGGSVALNAAENRIQVFFAKKPDEETRRELKANGFKWAPSKNAWQRQLDENGIRALHRMDCIQPKESKCNTMHEDTRANTKGA